MLSVDADQFNCMLEADCAVAVSACGTDGATVSPAGGGVVALAVFDAADTLPAISTARTVYEYEVAALSPVSVKIKVPAPTCVTKVTPRKIW